MSVRRNFSRGSKADILLIFFRLLMLTIWSATRRRNRAVFHPKFSKACLVVR